MFHRVRQSLAYGEVGGPLDCLGETCTPHLLGDLEAPARGKPRDPVSDCFRQSAIAQDGWMDALSEVAQITQRELCLFLKLLQEYIDCRWITPELVSRPPDLAQ